LSSDESFGQTQQFKVSKNGINNFLKTRTAKLVGKYGYEAIVSKPATAKASNVFARRIITARINKVKMQKFATILRQMRAPFEAMSFRIGLKAR
jgi:hypothetical protein